MTSSDANNSHRQGMLIAAAWRMAAALVYGLTAGLIHSAAPEWIWIEGENATSQQVTRNAWYESVPKAAFSGSDFLAHFDDAKTGAASYVFDAPAAGSYAFWLRANPNAATIHCQINGGEWLALPMTNVVQKFSLAGWDMRFLGWINAGQASLLAGRNEVRFRFAGQPKPHGMLDCFVFTQAAFEPLGLAHPDAAAERRAAAARQNSEWFAFDPPRDATGSLIDLRFLNEQFAGEHGRIQAGNGRFIHAQTRQPVRFWAVNGPPHGLQGGALKDCARLLARHGVNLVRVHGAVFEEQTGELQPAKVQHLVEVVEAMKAEGIYTHLSIYFPLWFKPRAGLSWLPGYNGNQNPFAALQFNREFQEHYRAWWRAVLAAKLSHGGTLAAEPALLGVELQNEDSFFFWTFSEANVPDPQLRILEKQFGAWLAKKHGSLAKAFGAWGGSPLKRDQEADGRAAFRPLYEMFSKRTLRDRDTAEFLWETQTAFYRETVQFLRDLGCEGLITCSNWTTANQEIFGPLEKLSYLAGDFVDRHGYFSCRSGGLFSEWSIRAGHTYVDRSALRFDAEEPGKPKQFNHPVIDIEYNSKPTMISETTWPRPNRYRPEAPLFLAAYGALQDSDAIVHFALDGAKWEVKPAFWMQPWTLMAPSQMAQFPAAALLYRRGLVATGEVLADLRLNLRDLKDLKGTPLPQDAAFDELRLKDVPAGGELKPGNRIDPLIHFAGRTRVAFSDGPAQSRVADLSRWIQRDRQLVTSSTKELALDYQRGVLRIDAPAAQGALGNLKEAGEITLHDLRLHSDLNLVEILLVPLDGQPLRSSRRMLLQVMSEEQNSQFQATSQGAIQLIENPGHQPWQVRKLSGVVQLTRPDASRLRVQALDLNGAPRSKMGGADRIELLPDCLYYLVTQDAP